MPAVNIAPYIRNQYFDSTGTPLAGGKLYTYAAGTEVNKATYSDAGGTTANANPIVLDTAGRAHIYLEAGAYDFVLKDSAGVTIWSEDGVSVASITTIVNTYADMKALVPGSYSIMRTLGRLTVNDGGGWWYYWNSTSTTADDGGMVVQPSSLPAAGRWIGIKPDNGWLNVRIYGPVLDGTTDDTAKLQACDTWCNANGCGIMVDASIYVLTNPSLVSRIMLLPSAQFRFSDTATMPITLKLYVQIGDNTRHFNCVYTRVPTLVTQWISPGWFGETYTTDPITTAAMSSATYGGTVFLKSAAISSFEGALSVPLVLTVTGVANLNGGVSVTGSLVSQGNLIVATAAPASSSAAGAPGTITWDANYIYVCIATDTWKRVAIATWS